MSAPLNNPTTLFRLTHFSPLRYPGGKGKLAAYVKRVIETNSLHDGQYVEPYAGGAAIALELLFHEYVSAIHINDVSRPIYAFWKSVCEHTEQLIRLIRDTPITVDTWDNQKAIINDANDQDNLALGFATFFLNRTNRSGILNGGIIGGRDQTGQWKIDARYNSVELEFRIESIARLSNRITVSDEDAHSFILEGLNEWTQETLLYLDPPYYVKGKDLYLDFYGHGDHEQIANLMTQQVNEPNWIVSYDDTTPIRDMYGNNKFISYNLGYSAREVRAGKEVMFFSPALEIPEPIGTMTVN